MEYQKTKSASKRIDVNGPELDAIILATAKTIRDIVGGTLGPGGRPVLIERYEHDLPPFITKDGVTVFRALGFEGSTAHCVLETSRDAAVRTASEAGDGTTTATILFEAIVRYVQEFCRANPRIGKQRVVRHLERVFTDHIEPMVKDLSRKVNPDTDEGTSILKAVAKISGNGDIDLAEAVMECFKITGDSGNVTISELPGPSSYQVERIKGYSVPMGYDESCGKFAPAFITNAGTQQTILKKPVFLLYHGSITEIQTIRLLMEQVGAAWESEGFTNNVVVAATGFSDSVVGQLAANFREASTINVFPLLVPQSIQANSQLAFLQDLQAITGATILDPINSPAETAVIADLGPGVDLFECSRTRSSVIGNADEDLLNARIEELEEQLEHPESEYDAILTRERLAKVSGGIARLNVIGSSNGETKEKRDRAEDAVCAVRGAIKYGCLPGGAWTLLKLCHELPSDDITDGVLRRAFVEPFRQLLSNCGVTDANEAQGILAPILTGLVNGESVVYDFLEGKHVDPYVEGILDSTPAVLEAIRNSISISSLLGTLGGVVSQRRDHDLERTEAQATAQFLRDSNINEANNRP